MKLKDCRILWNIDKEDYNLISDIEIHYFVFEDGCFPNAFLHEKFTFDLGNASKEWSLWNLEKILIEFFVIRKFKSEEIKNKFIKQLRKLDEFENNYLWLKS